MIHKQTHLEVLSEKILQGLRKATKNLVETKAAKNQNLVIRDKNGNIKIVPAKSYFR
jgi:hypothetical protein